MHHVPGRVHLPLNHPLRFRQQLGYIKYSIGPLRGSREIGQRAEMRVSGAGLWTTSGMKLQAE